MSNESMTALMLQLARANYALALHQDPGASDDDLREAVTTLEDVRRTARRIFGATYPITDSIEWFLRDARAALRARETPSI